MTDAEAIGIINDSMVKEFELDPEMMTPEAHLVKDLEMDSLDFVDLVVILQEAFGIKLRNDSSVREINTLGDLHGLVLQKKGQLEAEKK
ncbi:MAG: phosphopantetheine-binding protein [Sedimentisphaerales bacterium]